MKIMKLIRHLWKRLVFTGRNSLGIIWKNSLHYFVAHCPLSRESTLLAFDTFP
jgi:hypothetical protein